MTPVLPGIGDVSNVTDRVMFTLIVRACIPDSVPGLAQVVSRSGRRGICTFLLQSLQVLGHLEKFLACQPHAGHEAQLVGLHRGHLSEGRDALLDVRELGGALHVLGIAQIHLAPPPLTGRRYHARKRAIATFRGMIGG